MKYLILLTLFAMPVFAKPLVLISYFDAFSGASFNNSERVAKSLEAKFNVEASPVEIKLCSLNTIFDKAYAQTEDCLKAMTDKPVMVIALGESTCQLKVETIMRNNDKTITPDNAGTNRRNTRIVHEAPDVIGLRYPLPQMYCALTETERSDVDLSNNAGSFVCNNTAFQMSYHFPEIQYGFIHVPANNCANLKKKTEVAVGMLEKMILTGVNYLAAADGNEGLPHSSTETRLPTKKDEMKKLRRQYNDNTCLGEYLKKSKASDERRSIFGDLGRMN
jgi:pyrrolidone-carboxylate peptidase